MTWDFDGVRALLDDYVGNVDPADPKGRKRARILKAATDLFLERGYRKTSVDEIAERAGVAKGTVYLYFKTKVDLLVTATALEKREYIEHFRVLFDESVSPRQRLLSWARALLVVSKEMPLTSKLFLTGEREGLALLDDLPPKLLEQQEMGIEFLGDLVARASPVPLSKSQLRERVTQLRMLPLFAEPIANDHARDGLSLGRMAELVANTFVSGLFAAPSPPDTVHEDDRGKDKQ